MIIVFEGDFLRLRRETKWHRVVDIKPFDICVLDDGREVVAQEEEDDGIIAQVLSEKEYKVLGEVK